MKFSLNLLKQYVKINVTAEKLSELLTEHAFEVEEAVPAGGEEYSGIIAAKVLDVQKHPNADRLRVVQLDIGEKIVEPVVCGAFNFEANDVVVLALPGAKIAQNIHSDAHESFILGKAKIRGIESQGMICAEFELGLTNEPGDKPEIMLLDKSTIPGTPVKNIFKPNSKDYILNIALPANRPDLHSHLGLAREIAAVLNTKASFKESPIKLKASKKWKVEIKNKTLCPLYYGVKINIAISPSPKFISEFLTSVGMRPINNVVDITNYVMMEMGNPIHAFDASTVDGNIVVKTAKNNEKFLALNHKEYTLDEDTLMIADEKKYLGLAGIMGGKDSEVKDTTQQIILEVANFQATGIRKTGKRLKLSSEGGKMWERGIHPKLASLALNRTVELLEKYASGKIIDFVKFEAPMPKAKTINFTADEINRLLGTKLKISDISKYLSRYQIISKISAQKSALCTAPWWRTDVASVPDLAEEVLKLYGYNKIIPAPLNITAGSQAETAPQITNYIYKAKNSFARMGYNEVQNYNFVSEKDIIKFGGNPKDHVEILNPLSDDQRYLKKFPLIPILKNIALNQKHFSKFKLFEVSKKYLGYGNEPLLLLAGIFNKNIAVEKLVMVVKADVLEFLRTLGIDQATFSMDEKVPWLHLKLKNETVGGVGFINSDLASRFDIEGGFAFCKLELEKIQALIKNNLFKPINKFPKVKRDISVIVNEKIAWSNIEELIKPVSNLIVKIDLFEAQFLSLDKDSQKFHKALAEKGQKNLGIRLILEAFDRTLTDSEVARIMDKIVLKLKQELKAEIR